MNTVETFISLSYATDNNNNLSRGRPLPNKTINVMKLKGNHVWVLSYNAGVLGVYESKSDAQREKRDYQTADYKGLKLEEHLIG